MVSGGVERRFWLEIPESYDGRTPFPLVVALHPLADDYKTTPVVSRLTDMDEQYDFVTVSPSGLLDGPSPYWLAVPTADNHDVAFVSELLDLLESELCIDASRVYATGASNGGQMTSLLGCRLSWRFVAVAPIAGVEFAGDCAGEPVPVVAFHGTADPLVKYEGGGLDAAAIANLSYYKGNPPAGLPAHLGVDEAMRGWARHNGCDPEPRERQVATNIRSRTWQHCEAETILYIADGGGHDWPGIVVPEFADRFGATEMAAPELLLDFLFRQHRGS